MPTPEIIASISEFLIGNGFVVHSAGDGEAITVHVPLSHVRLPFGFRVLEDLGLLQIEGYLPIVVPEDKRGTASDFFNRINWGLKLGRFVMDAEDGEVRFRQELQLGGNSNSVDTAVVYLAKAGRMVDSFFPALTGVIFRDTSPEDAFEQGNKEYEILTTED